MCQGKIQAIFILNYENLTFAVDFAVVFSVVTVVVGTVVVTVTPVGEMEVMVAVVALLTINSPVTVPPSTFRISIFQVPDAIPSR